MLIRRRRNGNLIALATAMVGTFVVATKASPSPGHRRLMSELDPKTVIYKSPTTHDNVAWTNNNNNNQNLEAAFQQQVQTAELESVATRMEQKPGPASFSGSSQSSMATATRLDEPIPVVQVPSSYKADGSKFPSQSAAAQFEQKTDLVQNGGEAGLGGIPSSAQQLPGNQQQQQQQQLPPSQGQTMTQTGEMTSDGQQVQTSAASLPSPGVQQESQQPNMIINPFPGSISHGEPGMFAGSESSGPATNNSDSDNTATETETSNAVAVSSKGGLNKNNRLEFVHITKNGGSAIESAAAQQANIMWGACHYREIAYEGCERPDWEFPKTRRWERMPAGLKFIGEPWHSPPHWQEPNRMEGADTFLVVRNPYDRIISEYYCSSYGYKGPNPDDPDVFNNWIDGNVTLVTQELHGHMLPQHYYVYDENGIKVVDHILRYENLAEEFDNLMREYRIPITMPPKSSKTVHHTYRLRGSEKKRIFKVGDISAANIKLINNVYDRDFEYFRYPKIHAYIPES